jgi:hypothetical protein
VLTTHRGATAYFHIPKDGQDHYERVRLAGLNQDIVEFEVLVGGEVRIDKDENGFYIDVTAFDGKEPELLVKARLDAPVDGIRLGY